MSENSYTGLEFIEGFSLLSGALWIIGALLIGGLAMMGAARMGDGSVSPPANQTEAAAPATTQ
jgi:hypothetical protein